MNQATFENQFSRFCQMSAADGRFQPKVSDRLPVLDEDTPSHTAHDFDWTYLMHCGWAARVLARNKTTNHVDIGSYVYFASLCSAFVSRFWFYDVRELDCPLPGLNCGKANITDLPFPDNSLPSLSCLHVLEHIGLARYGDELDAKGDIKAAKELIRVLAPGGTLIMVLPMDENPRVVFNAHRLYSFAQVMKLFADLCCEEFSILYDGILITQPDFSRIKVSGTYTGMMVFTKT